MGVLAVAAVGLPVVPELDPQVVEEDVTRHRKGLGHVDRAADLTFVVVVRSATRPAGGAAGDGVGTGVVEAVPGRDETGLQRGRGRGELERRPRGVEALDGVVVQCAGGLDGMEVGGGDPVGPPRRVVGRRRHQRQDRAGLGIEGDRGALRGLALERGDLSVERLLQGLFEPRVDVGHHVVPRGGRRLAQAAHHLSVRVHLHLVGAGAAPQVRLVLVLEPALPEEVAELVALLLVVLQLLARDLTHVPEHLHAGLAQGVGAVGVGDGGDAGEHGRVLADVEDVGERGVLEDGHGLVQAVLVVGQVGLDLGGRDPEERGELPHHRGVLLGRHSRQGDVLGHLIAHDDVVAAVRDEPARRGDLDVAHLVGRDGLGVRGGVEDLQVPQPDEHEREQRRHDQAEHAQPDHGAWRRRLARRHHPVDDRPAGTHARPTGLVRTRRSGRLGLGIDVGAPEGMTESAGPQPRRARRATRRVRAAQLQGEAAAAEPHRAPPAAGAPWLGPGSGTAQDTKRRTGTARSAAKGVDTANAGVR